MVVGEIHARSVQQYVRAKIGVLFIEVLLSKLLVSVGLRFYQVILKVSRFFRSLAVRLVKQGTETTGFRTGSSLHLCQHVYMQASMIILFNPQFILLSHVTR